MHTNAVLSAPSRVGVRRRTGDKAVEWGVLPHPPSGRHEVNCMRENEAMGTVVDHTSVEFLDSQPVRPTTVVPHGPTLHQTVPTGVTECDEQSVVDEFDDETSDTASVDSRNGMSDFEGPVPSAAPVDPVASAAIALTEIDGRTQNAILRTSRGWKLFLLFRGCSCTDRSGRQDSKAQLQRRIESFSRGEWGLLLASAQESTSRGAQASPVRDALSVMIWRARQPGQRRWCKWGELSSARQALEGAAVAPGNDVALRALQDPSKRPPVLRDPIPDDILNVVPTRLSTLDSEEFARNVRSAKRGAAGRASGMTAEHLRVILESEVDTSSLGRAAQDLARAEVPPDVIALLRMGRLTALQKPAGGVGGIVCGDIVRRLVARTTVNVRCSAGSYISVPVRSDDEVGRRVAHAIQSLTDLNSWATVLTIDGISANDSISRAAMLDGLSNVNGGDAVLCCNSIPNLRSIIGWTIMDAIM